MNTVREFDIVYHLGGLAIHNTNIKLTDLPELLNDGSELVYAFNEILDAVLDLKTGESIYFQPNRDDKNSKGIIVRVK